MLPEEQGIKRPMPPQRQLDAPAPEWKYFTRSVVLSALLLAAIAYISPLVPPLSILGWTAHAIFVAPTDRWWYDLPAGRRWAGLYVFVATTAALIYPIAVAAMFAIWMFALKAARQPFPMASIALAGCATLASVAYFATGWEYAEKHQGPPLLLTYVLVDLLFLCGLAWAWRSARKNASWMTSLALHEAFCVWLCLAAFPWLGEFP